MGCLVRLPFTPPIIPKLHFRSSQEHPGKPQMRGFQVPGRSHIRGAACFSGHLLPTKQFIDFEGCMQRFAYSCVLRGILFECDRDGHLSKITISHDMYLGCLVRLPFTAPITPKLHCRSFQEVPGRPHIRGFQVPGRPHIIGSVEENGFLTRRRGRLHGIAIFVLQGPCGVA